MLAAAIPVISACESTEEEEAAEVALAFAEHSASHRDDEVLELVSAQDRAAADEPEELTRLQRHIRDRFDLYRHIAGQSYKVDTVSIDEESGTAVVDLERPWGGHRSVDMVREQGAWKVNAHWAEQKRREEEEEKARQKKEEASALVEEADELLESDRDFESARTKLEEALELSPEHRTAARKLSFVEDSLSRTIAGDWQTSESPDGSIIWIRLHSTDGIDVVHHDERRSGLQRARLRIRCNKSDGERRAHFTLRPVKVRADGGDRQYSALLRIDDQDVSDLALGGSPDGPYKVTDLQPFLEDIGDAEQFELTVSARSYREDQSWTFDLEGLDDAFEALYDECPKGAQ